MESVTITKSELVSVLKKNRAEHRAIFEEAVVGYQKQMTEALEWHIKQIKKNNRHRVSLGLVVPEDHTDDYNRAIKMMEMSVDDEISISEHDFAQYVMDDWGWQKNFLSTNSVYSASASKKLSRE